MLLKLKKVFVLLVLSMALPVAAMAQNITVTGTVTDVNGDSVIGAAVQVQNTTNGTVTDIDGKYSISVPGNAVLEVSSMGFQTQVISVNGRSVIDITMSEDSEALEGTVVIGYGTARKSDVTGSIASVNSEALRAVPAGDITRALEGRIAGVEMTQVSSKPGSSMSIRIRGTRSLSASNDPLIVLDGMPFMGSLTDISTSDIKSIDILKDAASTAIYGSRGSNGVILITTFKGVEGQAPRVSFNSYATLKKAVKYPMMDGAKFAESRRLAGYYTNTLDESDDMNVDWQDLMLRDGYTQNYDLNVSGGTKTGNYRFGVTYYNDEAVLPTQGFDRLAANATIDQGIGQWFKVGFTTNTSFTKNTGNQVGLGLSGSPIANLYNEDGSMKFFYDMPSDSNNYIWTRERVEEYTAAGTYVNESENVSTYNTGYVQFTFPWIKGLSFKSSVGLNYRSSTSGSFTGIGIGSLDTSPNSASISFTIRKNWTIEDLLTYDRTFGNHHINVVALQSAEQTTYNNQSYSGKNIPNELFQYFNIGQCNTADITLNNGNYNQSGLVSYMGRVMYTLSNKYMLSAAIRSDASSRLAKGHQWHTYPAVSVGWNLHNENFMAGTRNWLDELKVRLGYGQTSNQSISPYATLGALSTRDYNFADEKYATGYYVSSLPNEALGWEYSKTWNLGFDYSMMSGRFRGSLEFYQVDTEDILLNLGLPSTSGVSSYTANIGKTQNKGVEFSLNATLIDRDDFTWTAGLNLYANRNKLVALADGQTEDEGNRWFVGYPLRCIYDYEYDGLWQEGDPYMDILEPSVEVNGLKQAIGAIKVKYHGEYDANGAPVRAISSLDRVPINAEALFQGGLNTNLYYKNWDFSVIGAFQAGGILVSDLQGSNSYLNMLTGRRGNIDVDYWTPDNTDARYPRPGSLQDNMNPKYASTLSYFNGSYFKIRTITVGYKFQQLPAFKRLGVENLHVYATLQNPGIVLFSDYTKETGLDPEPNTEASARTGNMAYISATTPNTRNYLIGVNLTF